MTNVSPSIGIACKSETTKMRSPSIVLTLFRGLNTLKTLIELNLKEFERESESRIH